MAVQKKVKPARKFEDMQCNGLWFWRIFRSFYCLTTLPSDIHQPWNTFVIIQNTVCNMGLSEKYKNGTEAICYKDCLKFLELSFLNWKIITKNTCLISILILTCDFKHCMLSPHFIFICVAMIHCFLSTSIFFVNTFWQSYLINSV